MSDRFLPFQEPQLTSPRDRLAARVIRVLAQRGAQLVQIGRDQRVRVSTPAQAAGDIQGAGGGDLRPDAELRGPDGMIRKRSLEDADRPGDHAPAWTSI